MKWLCAFLALAMLPCRAADFFDATIRDDLKSALPEMVFVSGDPTWNGGLYASAFVGTTALDANSAYIVFKTTSRASAPSAVEMARRISAVIAGKYHVVLDDLGKWPKTDPPNVAKADFAANYAVGKVNNPRVQGAMRVVLTVQVVRLAGSQYGITVSYVGAGGP